jgi:hypothetical protein
MTKRTKLLLGIGLAIGIGGAIAGRNDAPAAKPAKPVASATGPDAEQAWRMARLMVSKQLKDPDSADFGRFKRDQGPDNCKPTSEHEWSCAGWVAATNSFGGKVRQSFTLRMRDLGNGSWEAVEGPTIR